MRKYLKIAVTAEVKALVEEPWETVLLSEKLNGAELACIAFMKNDAEAMKIAEKGDFDLAKAKIKEGDQEFVKGHEAHAGLIQKEANGEKVVPNILLMHAEDQLMSAETIKMMALEIIKLNQRLYSLEK